MSGDNETKRSDSAFSLVHERVQFVSIIYKQPISEISPLSSKRVCHVLNLCCANQRVFLPRKPTSQAARICKTANANTELLQAEKGSVFSNKTKRFSFLVLKTPKV